MAGAWHKYKRKRKGRWNTGEKEDIQKQALRAWLKTRTAHKGIFFVHGTYRTTVGCSLNSRSGQYVQGALGLPQLRQSEGVVARTDYGFPACEW